MANVFHSFPTKPQSSAAPGDLSYRPSISRQNRRATLDYLNGTRGHTSVPRCPQAQAITGAGYSTRSTAICWAWRIPLRGTRTGRTQSDCDVDQLSHVGVPTVVSGLWHVRAQKHSALPRCTANFGPGPREQHRLWDHRTRGATAQRIGKGAAMPALWQTLETSVPVSRLWSASHRPGRSRG